MSEDSIEQCETFEVIDGKRTLVALPADPEADQLRKTVAEAFRRRGDAERYQKEAADAVEVREEAVRSFTREV